MQDPKIQELKNKADAVGEGFRKAMREAMMKADPGLADILKERFKDKLKDGKPGEKPGCANLSEGDRQKLLSAREKAKDDPAVKAPEAQKSTAKTPEERQAAMEAFHKVMKDALRDHFQAGFRAISQGCHRKPEHLQGHGSKSVPPFCASNRSPTQRTQRLIRGTWTF